MGKRRKSALTSKKGRRSRNQLRKNKSVAKNDISTAKSSPVTKSTGRPWHISDVKTAPKSEINRARTAALKELSRKEKMLKQKERALKEKDSILGVMEKKILDMQDERVALKRAQARAQQTIRDLEGKVHVQEKKYKELNEMFEIVVTKLEKILKKKLNRRRIKLDIQDMDEKRGRAAQAEILKIVPKFCKTL